MCECTLIHVNVMSIVVIKDYQPIPAQRGRVPPECGWGKNPNTSRADP